VVRNDKTERGGFGETKRTQGKGGANEVQTWTPEKKPRGTGQVRQNKNQGKSALEANVEGLRRTGRPIRIKQVLNKGRQNEKGSGSLFQQGGTGLLIKSGLKGFRGGGRVTLTVSNKESVAAAKATSTHFPQKIWTSPTHSHSQRTKRKKKYHASAIQVCRKMPALGRGKRGTKLALAGCGNKQGSFKFRGKKSERVSWGREGEARWVHVGVDGPKQRTKKCPKTLGWKQRKEDQQTGEKENGLEGLRTRKS